MIFKMNRSKTNLFSLTQSDLISIYVGNLKTNKHKCYKMRKKTKVLDLEEIKNQLIEILMILEGGVK